VEYSGSVPYDTVPEAADDEIGWWFIGTKDANPKSEILNFPSERRILDGLTS